MEYPKDIINAAAWIVCPVCDEKVCVGRFECDEIKGYIDRNYKESQNDIYRNYNHRS